MRGRADCDTSRGMLTPQLTHPWELFPLYGLVITDDDGLAHPLFVDATLLSFESAMTLVAQASTPEHAKILASSMARDLHDPQKMPPVEYLLEVNPDSMIAVRREKEEPARERSEEIRALLSATRLLRGRTIGAFASRPASLVWSFEQTMLSMNKRNLHESTRTISSNENVTKGRVRVSKAQLRDSWNSGHTFPQGSQWDIHSRHSVSQVLGARLKGSSWLDKLRAIGVRINEACCASSPQHQLQMAVSTIESLMCSQSFSEVEERAQAMTGLIFHDGLTINHVLTARHEFVHQGRAPSDASRYAAASLIAAWMLFDFACSFAVKYPRQEQWDEYLKLRVHRARMCRHIEAFDAEVGSTAREAVDTAIKGLFDIGLTIRTS